MASIELEGAGAVENAIGDMVDNWGSGAEPREITNDTSYAPHVEWGTASHEITVNTAPVLTNGTDFFGKKVNHPGTDPQPYFRPAADATGAAMGRLALAANSLDEFLQLTSNYFYGEAVTRTPVDTGQLKRAWEQSGG